MVPKIDSPPLAGGDQGERDKKIRMPPRDDPIIFYPYILIS